MREGRGGGWQRDMEVRHGQRPIVIHNIVHRWSAPGRREQKGLLCMAKPYSSNLPHLAKLLCLGRKKMRKRQKQTQRDKTKGGGVGQPILNIHEVFQRKAKINLTSKGSLRSATNVRNEGSGHHLFCPLYKVKTPPWLGHSSQSQGSLAHFQCVQLVH